MHCGSNGVTTRIGRVMPEARSGRGLVDRGHTEAPWIERLERASHLHRAQAVAVSFDHRQQPAARDRGHRARVRYQRCQVNVHPGACRLGGKGHGRAGRYDIRREG